MPNSEATVKKRTNSARVSDWSDGKNDKLKEETMTKEEEAKFWEEVKQDAHDIMDAWAILATKQPEPKEEKWSIVVGDGST